MFALHLGKLSLVRAGLTQASLNCGGRLLWPMFSGNALVQFIWFLGGPAGGAGVAFGCGKLGAGVVGGPGGPVLLVSLGPFDMFLSLVVLAMWLLLRPGGLECKVSV